MSGSRSYATARTDCSRRIATWNVNTLYQTGQFDNLKREAERMMLDLVGVSEVRWTGSGHVNSDDWTFYYTGRDRHEAGVGVMSKRELAESVLGCWQVSKRVIIVKIEAKLIGLNIIQVYAPTSDHSDSEIDEFYEEVDQVNELFPVKIFFSVHILCTHMIFITGTRSTYVHAQLFTAK